MPAAKPVAAEQPTAKSLPTTVAVDPPAEKPKVAKTTEVAAVVTTAAIIPPKQAAPAHPTPTNVPPPPGELVSPASIPADWEAQRPWRWWLLLGASGITGIVLAISVVVVAAGFNNSDPPKIADNNPSPPDPPTETETTEPEVPPPNENPDPPEVTPPREVKPPEADLPPVPEPMPIPNPPEDPLGIAENPAENPGETPVEPSKVFGKLDEFGPLLNGNNGAPRDPKLDEAPPPAIPVDTTTDDSDAPARPTPRHVDVAARLNDPLLGIDAEGVALCDFLQVITEMSNVPITLRPEGLAMLKKTPHSPLALKLENTTVGAALSQAIKPLYFEMQTVDDQIVVRFGETMREMTMPLGDLAKGEPQDDPQTLITHITTLFDTDSWGDGKDQGQISYAAPHVKIFHRPLVLWQVMELTERLREVRSLPLAKARDDNYFRPVTRWERGRAARETAAVLNFAHPTRLTTIVDRLAAPAKLKILIDWQSLAELGWTPDTETKLTAKSTLAETLDNLTQPMELAWRVIDEKTLEISTPAALAQRAEIELFPLPAGTDEAPAMTIIAELKEAVGPAILQANGGVGEIRFDPAAKCLISYLPQAQQRVVEETLKAK